MKVYQSLTRPKLKNGGEWKPMLINGMGTIFLVWLAFSYREWWIAGVALVQYWAGRWLLRTAAKHDKQYIQIYIRSFFLPVMLMPQPRDDAPVPEGKPVLPRIQHWTH
jgi:type IV secretory pathway TrbD component